MTTGPAQLQLNELLRLSSTSLGCTVRCLTGLVRVGEPVRLTAPAGPIAGGLTVSAIELYANTPSDFLDTGRAALVTVTGTIDVAAVRAAAAGAAPGELARLDLRLLGE